MRAAATALIAAALFSAVIATGPVQAAAETLDFAAGLRAFESGDFATARKNLTPLAEKGDGEAQFQLALMEKAGLGGPVDLRSAKLWFHRAARSGFARAQYELAMFFVDDGLETRADLPRAVLWMTKAATGGSTAAQLGLGLMYRDGTGVPANAGLAVKWTGKAAQAGLAEAQFQYGIMHYQGKLMPQDYKTAARWTLMAAEQGHTKAQVNLGYMYSTGTGLAKHVVEAHKWFNLAAARGDKEAFKSREALARSMSPPQIAKAQAMATSWKPKR